MRPVRSLRRPTVLVATLCLTLLASPATAAIYWTNQTSHSGPDGATGAAVGRAALDGGQVDRDWLPVGSSPRDLELARGRLYWPESGRIASADVRTGKVRPEHVLLPEHTCSDECDLAVLGDHLYWADSGSEHLGRARLDGSAVDPQWMRLGAAEPTRIASDGSSLVVALREGDQHSLWRVRPGPLAATRLLPLVRLEHLSALAAAGDSVYYGGFVTDDRGRRQGRVGRVSRSGADDPTWFDQDSGAPADPEWFPAKLAVLGQHLYFSAEFSRELDSGAVGRVRLRGGGAEPYLVTHGGDLFLPYGLAVDGTAVRPPTSKPPVRRTQVKAAKRQRLKGSSVRVRVKVRSSAGRVRATVRGAVVGAGPRVPLAVRTRVVRAGRQVRLVLRAAEPRRKVRERRVRRAVERGRPVRARVRVRLVDGRGHQRRVTRVVRLVR